MVQQQICQELEFKEMVVLPQALDIQHFMFLLMEQLQLQTVLAMLKSIFQIIPVAISNQ